MITVELVFRDGNGNQEIKAWNVDGEAFLTSLSLKTESGEPIVRIPFTMHGDSRLHTICRLDSDEIDAIEI